MKNIEYRYPYSRETFINNCITMDREVNEDYRIKFSGDDEILFGVERAGHSGGYWFKSRLIESDNGLHIIGEMILMDFDNKKIEFSKKDKIKETLFMIIFIILTWWLFIIFWIVKTTNKLYNKIIGKKLEPQLTKEEKLDRLMINLLCCEKVQE